MDTLRSALGIIFLLGQASTCILTSKGGLEVMLANMLLCMQRWLAFLT